MEKIKINLSSIKSWHNMPKEEQKKKEKEKLNTSQEWLETNIIPQAKTKKEELETNLPSDNSNNKTKENSSEEKVKIKLSSIKKVEENKIEDKKDDNTKKKEESKKVDNTKENSKKEEKAETMTKEVSKEEENKEKKDLFLNYESRFKKEWNKILEKLKKLKDIPKTRKWLVLSLIAWTAIFIWILFIVDPNTHSISNYKASIIYNLNKLKQEDDNQDIIPEQIEKTKIKEEQIKSEIVKLLWYKFDISYNLDPSWKEIYSYAWNNFNSKEELLKFLNKELEKLKKQKVIKFLKENFSE